MTTIIFLLTLALATSALARFVHLQREDRRTIPTTNAPRPSPRPPAASAAAPPRRPAPRAPALEALAWDGASEGPSPRPSSVQARIRDRYIAARFPGAMRNASDLASPLRVIDVARLYFEEGESDCAHDLLEMAIEVSPRHAPLRLAQIEIAFLGRDGPRLLRAARGLHEALPQCPQWADVQRLGRALLPDEGLFGECSGARDHEHYGPWPDTPNWIGASWDLTGDVRAAEFHHAMTRTSPPSLMDFRTAT
jgi:hypothetical protein